MDAVLPQEVLQEVFDQVVREVTEQEAGIQLCLKDASPKGELYTVYAAFETGFHSSLSMCAEESMFTRLTQNMMDEEEITHEDLEDFTLKYSSDNNEHVWLIHHTQAADTIIHKSRV